MEQPSKNGNNMASFQKLCESMKRPLGQDFWQKPPEDDPVSDKAMDMIQRGLEIRADRTDGETFWNDFITVIGNNPDDASELFGIPRERISSWSKKIKDALKQTRKDNASADDKKKKTEMLPTGIREGYATSPVGVMPPTGVMSPMGVQQPVGVQMPQQAIIAQNPQNVVSGIRQTILSLPQAQRSQVANLIRQMFTQVGV